MAGFSLASAREHSPIVGLSVIHVGAGLPRETGSAEHGTGFAGVRGTSPLPQQSHQLLEVEQDSCSHRGTTRPEAHVMPVGAALAGDGPRSGPNIQRCTL